MLICFVIMLFMFYMLIKKRTRLEKNTPSKVRQKNFMFENFTIGSKLSLISVSN